jgi:hypothetical protein
MIFIRVKIIWCILVFVHKQNSSAKYIKTVLERIRRYLRVYFLFLHHIIVRIILYQWNGIIFNVMIFDRRIYYSYTNRKKWKYKIIVYKVNILSVIYFLGDLIIFKMKDDNNRSQLLILYEYLKSIDLSIISLYTLSKKILYKQIHIIYTRNN